SATRDFFMRWKELSFLTMTVLILFTASAGTGVVTSDLRTHFDRFLFNSCIRTTGFKTISFTHTIIFPGGVHLFLIRTHLAVVGFLRTSFFKRRILFLDRDGRVGQEGNDVLVYFSIHVFKLLKCLHLIDDQGIFL